jgi:tRNA(Ile2) C34 agmatinyltransferase TiaS
MVVYVDPPKPKIVKCKDCGKDFEQKGNVRYPRKYCKKCSEIRKKDYENLWKVKAEDCDEA